MIVTVTPNPSIDRTVTLGTPLTRGAVHRVSSVTTEPGGKGVNVARALTLAGVDAVAAAARIRHRSAGGRTAGQRRAVPLRADRRAGPDQPRRSPNTDGTTTKLNEPGAPARRRRRSTR